VKLLAGPTNTHWVRTILVLLAVATFVQCGGGGDDDGIELAAPLPGTFVGTLGDGAPLRIDVVDGIREIAFACDGLPIEEVFDPPRSVDEDGRFDVTFIDRGRAFDVHGHFSAKDAVDGTLADQLHECDGTFAAVRVQPLTPAASPPTPTVTPPEEPFPGTFTVTPTPTFTDGNFFPFSPICTPTPRIFDWPFPPTPSSGFAFGRRLR
jgi:hypothetical protein